MQFPEYMRGRFPELQLGPDLFHKWTVGIRFELNANHWPNVQWDAVLDRAKTIYEAVFQQGDIGFIVSGHEFEFEDKGRGPGKIPEFRNSVFALSRKKSLGLHGIAGRQRVRVSRTGNVWGPRISEKLVWWIVRQRAQVAGIERLAPHDLRRTCARLCHASGGELEQIQFLLGHRSVETTERYLGSRQRLVSAVNDKIGLEPDSGGP